LRVLKKPNPPELRLSDFLAPKVVYVSTYNREWITDRRQRWQIVVMDMGCGAVKISLTNLGKAEARINRNG
jgi:hypothetical protein